MGEGGCNFINFKIYIKIVFLKHNFREELANKTRLLGKMWFMNSYFQNMISTYYDGKFHVLRSLAEGLVTDLSGVGANFVHTSNLHWIHDSKVQFQGKGKCVIYWNRIWFNWNCISL